MSTAVVQYKETPFNEMQAYAKAAANSKLFGVDNENQAISLMLVAQSQGLHPATAFMDYHVVKGRPTLKAEAMLARHQADGGVLEWLHTDDFKATARVSHPTKSPTPIEITWTVEKAQGIGLTSNPSWKNYPAAMLRARVTAESIRAVNPSVLRGFYAYEEAQDFSDKLEPEKKTLKHIESESIDHVENPAITLEPSTLEQYEEFTVIEIQLSEERLNKLWEWINGQFGIVDKSTFLRDLSFPALQHIIKAAKKCLAKQQQEDDKSSVNSKPTNETKGE